MKYRPLLAEIGNQAAIDVLDVFHSLYEGVAKQIAYRIFLKNQTAALKKRYCTFARPKTK